MNRRQLLAVLGGAFATRSLPGFAQALAQRFRVGYSGYVWGDAVEDGIETIARFGFHGIEPFRQHMAAYLESPEVLKARLDAAGVALISCSNGGPGMSTNFIDPSQVSRTIEDHVAFARDFLTHFGCEHFKINLGSRPEGGPTDEHLRTMATTLTEIGRRVADLGLKLAPHPHIWSPLERPEEIARVVELTDPRYVYFTADTAHLTLGGTDPVAFIRDNYSRIAAYHFKDTPARFRGHRGATPTREEHRASNLYTVMGSGGVDFPAITALLVERDYGGWVTLDYDPPREDEGTVDQQLTRNKEYMVGTLGLVI